MSLFVRQVVLKGGQSSQPAEVRAAYLPRAILARATQATASLIRGHWLQASLINSRPIHPPPLAQGAADVSPCHKANRAVSLLLA